MIGLGNMGAELATNLADAGQELLAFDLAGPDRAPAGATFAENVAEVSRRSDVILLSLPDGQASAAVVADVVATPQRRVGYLIDTSTVGISTAEANAAVLGDANIGFVDAAVSGGPAGARARTLLVMYAAPVHVCSQVEPVLRALSDRRQRVGDRPGMAQAAKLANNFLSATALASTSEALSFAASVGIDMGTMLDVLNASSGQSAATSDKFPNHVLNGRYASGFSNSLMAKDLRLYLTEATRRGRQTAMSDATTALWERFATRDPGADFTRIYAFVEALDEETDGDDDPDP